MYIILKMNKAIPAIVEGFLGEMMFLELAQISQVLDFGIHQYQPLQVAERNS